jgi:FtsX extracellular domain
MTFFSFTFYSCRTQISTSDSVNFNELNWIRLDSFDSYYVYNNSDRNLISTDSVKITFSGKLNKDNSLSNTNLDSLLSCLFSGYHFGTFIILDSSIDKSLQNVIHKMTKNSMGFVKWRNDSRVKTELPEFFKMSIYFKENADSLDGAKFALEIKSNIYVDSYKYISKNDALKSFAGQTADFKDLLKTNPLPSSLEIEVNPNYFNLKSLDSIKSILLKDRRVSDIIYTNPGISDSPGLIKLLKEMSFIVKIKT